MKFSTKHKIALGFASTLFGLASVSAVSYANHQRSIEDNARRAHTYHVLERTTEVLDTLVNAEAEQRRYLITGRTEYLDPFHAALYRNEEAVRAVRALTADNPQQQRRLDALEPLIVKKVDELKQTISLRETLGFEAAQKVLFTNEGNYTTDEIRKTLAEIEAEENKLAKEGSTAIDRGMKQTAVLSAIGTGLSLLAVALAIYSIRRDITELRKTDEALEQMNRELARSNAELDGFAYAASHDLKSPLRAIDSLSGWIAEDLGDALKGESRQHFDLLRGRVLRMERLLDDLLKYARIGRAEERIEAVDTDALIRDIAGLLKVPDGFRVGATPPMPTVRAAKIPLETVFRNLIDNAIKHHDRPDGSITVCAHENGAFWEFEVADDGPGIPPEFREKAFQIFQTLKPRDEREGSGMGLAIVKKIVQNQGGSITLDANPGRGARFRFTWPKDRPEATRS